MIDPIATVLIPTHSRAASLRLAVASVLAQSIQNLEVIIIGDGVSDELRATALELQHYDDRVQFTDNPKSPNHGEAYRHDAIIAARSGAIFYLCDDDLFLRDHVKQLLELLESRNFVQSLNGVIGPDDVIQVFPANIADQFVLDAIVDSQPVFNSVGISGTAHRRDFYLRVNEPWTTTPTGAWPDHHQWKKLMRHPDFSGVTADHMTVVQLPTSTHGRETWSEQERLTELNKWAKLVAAPDAQEQMDRLVYAALLRQGRWDYIAARDGRLNLESLSWRITRPLRRFRAWTFRLGARRA